MVCNVPLLTLRPGRSRRRAAATPTGPAVDEGALVLGWLRRCLPGPVAEDLAVQVLTRAGAPGPDCVARAPREVRLQFLAVRSVLRARGLA